MKQISKILGCLIFLFAVLFISSCTDDTDKLGIDMMPPSDTLRVFYDDYIVPTQTYEVEEPILARTSRSYLGQFTDPETGTAAKADFIAQYHITESSTAVLFPITVVDDKITSVDVRLYISDFIGEVFTILTKTSTLMKITIQISILPTTTTRLLRLLHPSGTHSLTVPSLIHSAQPQVIYAIYAFLCLLK